MTNLFRSSSACIKNVTCFPKFLIHINCPPSSNPNGRVGGADMDWSKIYSRYPVQRSVKVWHVLADILIEWDADLNDPNVCKSIIMMVLQTVMTNNMVTLVD